MTDTAPISRDLALAAFLARLVSQPVTFMGEDCENLDAATGGILTTAVERGVLVIDTEGIGSYLHVPSAGTRFVQDFEFADIVEIPSGNESTEFGDAFRRRLWAHLIMWGSADVTPQYGAFPWGLRWSVAHLVTCGAVVRDFSLPLYDSWFFPTGESYSLMGTVYCRCSRDGARTVGGGHEPVRLSIPMDVDDVNTMYQSLAMLSRISR